MTSPGGELWVQPSHLRELSDKQSDAAMQIANATGLTIGEADAVQRSHGLVCSPTHAAAQAAEQARAKACAALQSMSDAFAANLNTAASKYDLTDETEGGKIDGEMRPG